MRKFKKMIAGLVAAMTIVSSMVVPASAEIELKPGSAAAIKSVIGAAKVECWTQCSPQSATTVTYRLRRSGITDKSEIVPIGGYRMVQSSPQAPTTMWQFTISPTSGTNARATGDAYQIA